MPRVRRMPSRVFATRNLSSDITRLMMPIAAASSAGSIDSATMTSPIRPSSLNSPAGTITMSASTTMSTIQLAVDSTDDAIRRPVLSRKSVCSS